MIDGAVRWRAFAGTLGLFTAGLAVSQIVVPRWDDGGSEVLEGWALLALFVVPSAFALLACLNRPTLLIAAAMVSVATSPFLGLLMPILWMFAAVYAMAFARQSSQEPIAPAWSVGVVPVVLVIIAGSMILGSTEMVCTPIGEIVKTCGSDSSADYAAAS